MDHLKRKVCWNTKCPAINTSVWKSGWRLQSGRIADLCEYCGLVYERFSFCETFHADDAGWRTCNICKKRIHCGCIASVSTFVHLDLGGIECMDCSKKSKTVEISSNISSESTSLTRAGSMKLSEHSSEDEQAIAFPAQIKKRKLMDTTDNVAAKVEHSDPTPGRQSQEMQTSDDLRRTDGKAQQVLPRYMPQNTEEKELQRAADGSLTTIVPLFEKMLTASDAGRIGRLVLPKACAEAFFPPISVPEGIPIKMTDMLGQEWQFQFRFWPNNSSRMYVLEGITACVRSLQLQAGDVVTFSRIDPGGRMVMGYRRITSAAWAKNGKGVSSNQSRENGALISNLIKNTKEALLGSPSPPRTSWEEAQDLLTPPPGVTPSIMTIDGHRFEEYEEPPVLVRKMTHALASSPLAGL